MALPPQLEQILPETAGTLVSQLCEMAPWSNQILDDMLETLKDNSMSSKLALSPPADGITKIEADLFCDYQRVKKGKTEIRGIRAVVHY